jgi:hypothetical protein
VKKGENFYRRDPSKALSGMIGLTLEERGVYNTVLDLLYSTWRPLEDDRPFLANWCGCAVQKLNPIIRRLIEKGRLITFTEGGRTYLSDEAFEAERAKVKGDAPTRSGRALVGEKSGEVGEKSAGVGQNTGLLETESTEKQSVTALEKNREEKKDPPTPQGAKRRKPETPLPDDCPSTDLVAAMQSEARETGANIDLSFEARQFRDWWTAKDGRNRDWAAAWRTWARRAIGRAPKTATASLAGRTAMPNDDARWRSRVREFKANRYWPTDDAGPRPGAPGCRAPAHILAEFGLSPSPANDAPLLRGEAVA